MPNAGSAGEGRERWFSDFIQARRGAGMAKGFATFSLRKKVKAWVKRQLCERIEGAADVCLFRDSDGSRAPVICRH